jgi:coenzyme F420-reducing hydrogenase delta subunit/DNA-binding transcriptional ArsR family regulator
LAGVSRIQYPHNIRIIRIMCSSRLEPSIILEMFIQGIDGIFIGGCHFGDCHYMEGNYHAIHKIELTKKLMERAGLNPNRLRLEWVSASEGQRFAQIMKDMSLQIKELGPNPISGKNPDLKIMEQLLIARNAADDFRLRLLVGKTYILTDKANAYNNKIEVEKYKEIIDEILEEELLRQRILMSLSKKSQSVKGIAKDIKTPSRLVLEHLVVLRDRGLVGLERIEGQTPIYSYAQKD